MQDDYAFGRDRAEYERLIEQAEIFRPLTERMLRNAGIGAGMHVLDIGCGAGDVSFLVSALVGPEGSVTGVDVDGDPVAEPGLLADSTRIWLVLRLGVPVAGQALERDIGVTASEPVIK